MEKLLNSFYRNKYIATIRMSMQQQYTNRAQMMGRIFLYFMVVYLFYQVFQSVSADPNRVWYLAITEWVALSAPNIAFRIVEDIRSGQIVYFMLRPMNYLMLRFCESLGALLVRYISLGISCFAFAWYLTGYFPNSFYVLLIGTLISFLSILLYSLISILIGIFSFWLKEIQSLIYLNLTATFCFGGLIVPLGFYSETLRTVSFFTPYPWMLWWPAEIMTGHPPSLFLGLSIWTLWFLIVGALIIFSYRQCLKHFVSEGG